MGINVVESAMRVGKVMDKASEAYQRGGIQACLQMAKEMHDQGFQLTGLFKLANSKIEIPKPMQRLEQSRWDGQTIAQFDLRPVQGHGDRTRLDDLMPRDAHLMVVLIGAHNRPEFCLRRQKINFLESR